MRISCASYIYIYMEKCRLFVVHTANQSDEIIQMICCWFAKHMIVELILNQYIILFTYMERGKQKATCAMATTSAAAAAEASAVVIAIVETKRYIYPKWFTLLRVSSFLDFQLIHTFDKLIWLTMLWTIHNNSLQKIKFTCLCRMTMCIYLT